jgi:hypothetical protein
VPSTRGPRLEAEILATHKAISDDARAYIAGYDQLHFTVADPVAILPTLVLNFFYAHIRPHHCCVTEYYQKNHSLSQHGIALLSRVFVWDRKSAERS